MCAMTHLYLCHDSSISVTYHPDFCQHLAFHSFVRDSLICVTWPTPLLGVHDSHICVITSLSDSSLTHICYMTHLYVWYDALYSYVWYDNFNQWLVTHSYVWHDSLICWYDSRICVTWLTHMCEHDSLIYVPWLTPLIHESLLCVTWVTHMRDMTHSYVLHDQLICVICRGHDSLMCVTWLLHFQSTVIETFTDSWHFTQWFVTHSYAWYDTLICVISFTQICEMTYSHVWHDALICVTWRIHMCDMSHSHSVTYHRDLCQHFALHSMTRDSFICATWRTPLLCLTWLIHMSHTTHDYLALHSLVRDSLIRVTGLTHVWDMTHSYEWHDSFIWVTRHITVSHFTQWLVTHSCVWHDSLIDWIWLTYSIVTWLMRVTWLICVTWLIHIQSPVIETFTDIWHFNPWFVIHVYVWYIPLISVTWLTHWFVTHSCVRHDSLITHS